jgi:hypothetical protein
VVATVLRRTVAALLLVLALAALWTAVVLGAARTDLTQARAELESATDADEADEVGVRLTQAEARLQRTVDRLGQPGPALVGRLPLVGRSVRAVDVTAEAALAVTSASRDVVAAADGASLRPDGAVDLRRLSALGEALERAGQDTGAPVSALVSHPDRLVPPPVAGPLREAQDRLGAAPGTFSKAADAVRALRGLLGADGPRRLLVVLENNAELRGTGGLVSVFAEATTADGAVQVEAFRDVKDVADEPQDVVRVPSPDDYRALWGPYLADSTLWVNTNMAPDVPTSAQVLAEVAAVTLPERPDAVLRLDVPALAAVLAATGPVPLPDGSELRGEDTVEFLLSRAYVDAPDTIEGQAQRRETLRSVADAVLGRLLGSAESPPSLVSLGPALADAARGRHLALWSADPEEQDLLVAADLAGRHQADGGDLSSVTVQNLGGGDTEGNKLDFYARRSVSVVARVGSGSTQVLQTVTLRNEAPASGLPQYVAGGAQPGTTNNLVTLAVPDAAEDVVLRRAGQPLDSPPRPQGDHQVVADVVSLPPGTGVTWELSYRLASASDRYELRLLPQPLHEDAALSVELHPGEGRRLATPSGSALAPGPDDTLVLDQPFAEVEDLVVTLERPGLVARALGAVKRFWNEPVQLP